MKTLGVAVYCGASEGLPSHLACARETGRLLAERGVPVVYGGGKTGLMGAVADAALAAGGEVHGFLPDGLDKRELKHTGLTSITMVATMHERKALMAERSRAFLALPGGFGTLDEIFEAVTWTQLGFHDKRCVVVNHEGYYDGLAHYVRRALADGLLRLPHADLLVFAKTAEEGVLAALR